jgi:uncharacterized protein (DUF1015 family)
MPEIQAFRGIRYNLGHIGSLSDVIAPPYDVISPEFQDELYKKHPCNVIRLILNRMEPGDDDASNNRYTRAARHYKNWQSEGVLFTEADPAIYVYHQIFTEEGTTYTRRGFMARLRISPFGEGQVFPHEETMPGPKMDRLALMTVCQANLSQIFAIYPDEQNEAQNLLENAIAGKTPIEAHDHLGVIHRMWPVTDVSVASAVSGAMSNKPLFVADGHHRYETAADYREQVRQSGFLSVDHPANFVLTMCVAMDDPGMIVLPTHRLFNGLPELTAEELIAKLGDSFATRPGGEGPDAAGDVWEDIETGDDQATIGLFTQKDGRWTIATLTDAGRQKMAEVAKDHSEQWQGLGVSILQRLIVVTLLESPDAPKPKYVHAIDEVAEGCRSGEHSLAAIVMPATLEHVRDISLGGERMPPKSTYFYPKLLSGLVFNPLE